MTPLISSEMSKLAVSTAALGWLGKIYMDRSLEKARLASVIEEQKSRFSASLEADKSLYSAALEGDKATYAAALERQKSTSEKNNHYYKSQLRSNSTPISLYGPRL